MKKAHAPITDAAIIAAARDYLSRKNRTTKPGGKSDGGGRWYPSESERRRCCDYIREPSRGWPWSLLKHCSTADHVAELHGVDVVLLRRAVREIQRGEVTA